MAKTNTVAKNHDPVVVQIAVPVPLRRCFDYTTNDVITIGSRILVSFGKRKLMGILVSSNPTTIPVQKLKPVLCHLDERSVFSNSMFELVRWSAQYYHCPIGEAFSAALPAKLRTQDSYTDPTVEPHYRIMPNLSDEQINSKLSRSPKQREAWELLMGFALTTGLVAGVEHNSLDNGCWVSQSEILQSLPGSQPVFKRLIEKQLIEIRQKPSFWTQPGGKSDDRVVLTPEQRSATKKIIDSQGQFAPFLLNGITGSGKTEVYLNAAEYMIEKGLQVLVLVPEISLTPQLINRFMARLGNRVCAVHSSLTDQERYTTWWRANQGETSVVLGTRSAVFTPLKNPGLIIIDEEHDISYKQQDGFRYHARDVAIKRASIENIPIVLGSATPSMESIYNQENHRYQSLVLTHRAGQSSLPVTDMVDLKTQPMHDGVSLSLFEAVRDRIQRQEQSILYINRRGFAPVIQCGQCGWQALCSRCDSHLIYHQTTHKFRCHHCNSRKPSEKTCPKCQSILFFAGFGTQRIEESLRSRFPEARISRLDRDEVTTQRKLEEELEKIAHHQVDIIIGTQLITKGHDFPKVTLVGVINSDQGLHSIDFRSTEYLFQQLVQVSGRAGRGDLTGRVLIQTAYPDNTYLDFIKNQDFTRFSQYCLGERKAAQLPPYSHIALWRSESTNDGDSLRFLQNAKAIGEKLIIQMKLEGISVMDAVHSPMEKLAGRYRAQLLVRSSIRRNLHLLLNQWIHQIEHSRSVNRVRWSLDIDPMEMF